MSFDWRMHYLQIKLTVEHGVEVGAGRCEHQAVCPELLAPGRELDVAELSLEAHAVHGQEGLRQVVPLHVLCLQAATAPVSTGQCLPVRQLRAGHPVPAHECRFMTRTQS
ncbi:unnamed protein product, partial [Ixodes pacificus]